MAYKFRNPGPWGGGSLEDLDAIDVDNNFWQAIQDIRAKATQGVGIDNIVVSGSQFTVVLTNHTLLGPYQLPTVKFIFKGEWLPNYAYLGGSIITDNGSTYFIPINHVSEATFDPGANDGKGQNFYELLLQNPALTLPTGGAPDWLLGKATGADYVMSWRPSGVPRGGGTGYILTKASPTDYALVWSPPGATAAVENTAFSLIDPVLTDAGKYFRCTSSADVTVVIPLDANVPFAVGTELKFRQCNTGAVTLVGEELSPDVVTLNMITGYASTTAKQGAVIEAIKVGADEWDVFGYVEKHS